MLATNAPTLAEYYGTRRDQGVLFVFQVRECVNDSCLSLHVQANVPGASVASRIYRGEVFVESVVRRITAALCDALAALHGVGVAHGPLALDDVYLVGAG